MSGDPQFRINIPQRLSSDIAGAFGADGEDRTQSAVVDLGKTLLEGPEELDNCLGEFGFEVAIAFALKMCGTFLVRPGR